jgi:methionyl-tRNA formyltransferase
VEAGDTETGVTIMQMDAGLDTGPMLSITRCPIGNTDTSGSIYNRLAELGGPALVQAIDKLNNGTAVALAQNNSLSSYAEKIDKAEAEINWADSARMIDRRIRAFNPFPCTYSKIDQQRVKIWASCLEGLEEEETTQGKLPGEILRADADGLLISCGQGCLLVSEIQLAGKSRMAVAEVLKSRADLFAVGRQLGQ